MQFIKIPKAVKVLYSILVDQANIIAVILLELRNNTIAVAGIQHFFCFNGKLCGLYFHMPGFSCIRFAVCSNIDFLID